MICLKFKNNAYVILVNCFIFEVNKLLLKHLKQNDAGDSCEKFIRKGTKILIKKMGLICSWDNIQNIKYEFNKIKYIIEKNIDIMDIMQIEEIFHQNINNGKEVFKIIKFMVGHPELKIILSEVELYKKELLIRWNSNISTLNYYTENILGYSSDIIGTVYLVSNRYYTGQADLESRNARIIYGSKSTNGDINKDIVYIYHEILHNPILKYERFNGDKKLIHNIIRLVADKHLNNIINHEMYFENGYIDNYLLKLYPYWIKYLYKSNKGKSIRVKYLFDKEISILEKFNYNVQKLITEFNIDFENNRNYENNIIDFVKFIESNEYDKDIYSGDDKK